MSLACTLFRNYDEVNEAFNLSGDRAMSNDKNAEDPALIVYVRKWSWDEMGDPPDLSFLCLNHVEHVRLGDKTDLFIYGR